MEINLDNENNIKNKKLYEDRQEEKYENFYKKNN